MPSLDNILGLSGCVHASDWRNAFWTAGQMIDPSRESTYVWITSNTTMSRMIYTNWLSGQPDYSGQGEACINFASGWSYKWNDFRCIAALCSVCELDISQ